MRFFVNKQGVLFVNLTRDELLQQAEVPAGETWVHDMDAARRRDGLPPLPPINNVVLCFTNSTADFEEAVGLRPEQEAIRPEDHPNVTKFPPKDRMH